MKHLHQLLREMDLPDLEQSTLSVLDRYMMWMQETNRKLNITAVTGAEGITRLHLLDSLAALPELASAPPGPVLDLGTGGGLPGIPLAVATGRHTVLLDSVGKKAAAIQSFIDEEGLTGLEAVAGRAEDFAVSHAGYFAVVLARAVTALPSLVELAAPLLASDGHLIAFKGAPTEDEIARGDAAGDIVGLQRVHTRTYVLPDGGEQRALLVFARVKDPSVSLPRRVGMAQKRPLA